MTSEPTTVEKLQGLRWANASNAALSVFVQLTFFGSVFVLFLNQLGLSKSQIGFVLSLMPFTGLIALFIAPAVARFGYKRTYVASFGLRNVVAAGLLLTPIVVARAGPEAGMLFVTAIVAVFSVLRSIGITASTPWQQEYVPNSVRGKFTATNNAVSTFTGFLAVTVAGLVLARASGLGGYMALIAVGIVFGFISVALSIFIPGGAPQKEEPAQQRPRRDLRAALLDTDFMRYLVGVGLFTVATVPVGSFMSLYMQEQIGLASSQVVRLQNGVLIGALVSSYLWGWAADRYGSKPVILYGAALACGSDAGLAVHAPHVGLEFRHCDGALVYARRSRRRMGGRLGPAALQQCRPLGKKERLPGVVFRLDWPGGRLQPTDRRAAGGGVRRSQRTIPVPTLSIPTRHCWCWR